MEIDASHKPRTKMLCVAVALVVYVGAKIMRCAYHQVKNVLILQIALAVLPIMPVGGARQILSVTMLHPGMIKTFQVAQYALT